MYILSLYTAEPVKNNHPRLSSKSGCSSLVVAICHFSYKGNGKGMHRFIRVDTEVICARIVLHTY